MMLVSAGSCMRASVWSVRWYWVWQSEQSLLVVGLPHASHVFAVGVAIACVCPFFGEGDAEDLVWDSECLGDFVLADAVCLEPLRVLDLLSCQSSSHVAS
jgi:hypothetical protein